MSRTDNHKPNFPTESTRARLKPAAGGKPNSFDLNFIGSDGRTEYAYEGARTVGDGRYVLYFDPGREAFVLDRMDSTFHMNLTRTPTNTDPESLSRKYPHLDDDAAGTRLNKSDGSGSTTSSSGGRRAEKSKPKVARAKSPLVAPTRKKEPAATARRTEKKTATKNINLELPQADKATASKAKTTKAKSRQAEEKKKKKGRVDDDEEEDEDGDDDLLLVEYPGGAPKSQSRDFSPAFPSVRRFDEFMDQRESEADDADGESLGDPDTDFKLPSPVNNGNGRQDEDDGEDGADPMDVDEEEKHQQQHQQYHVDNDDDAGSPNLEDDLEKDLEEAFEAVANSQNGTPADGDESEISEED
jgi:hypothetical protein